MDPEPRLGSIWSLDLDGLSDHHGDSQLLRECRRRRGVSRPQPPSHPGCWPGWAVFVPCSCQKRAALPHCLCPFSVVFSESRQGSSLGSGARGPESLQDGRAESPEQAKCVPTKEGLDTRYSALSHLFSCSFKIIKLIVMLIKCQTVQELP